MTLALAVGSPQARAQSPRYRLTPLVKFGFTPNPDTNGTLGINNKGQVVYGYIVPNTSTYHAWVWLPASDYGLAQGFHDLSSASSSGSDATAIARDINESGIVVGQAGAVVHLAGSGTGAAWTLSGGTVTFDALPLFSGGAWSSANAINDESPPVIVGVADSGPGVCDCANQIEVTEVPTPFKMDFTGTLNLTALTVGTDVDGMAQDVNTPQGSDPLRIAGFTDCTGTQQQEGRAENECTRAPNCRPPMDAVNWSPTTRNVMNDFGSSGGAQARGLNESGNLVGWGFEGSGFSCGPIALYWSSSSATRIELGDTMPSGQSADDSRAEAINDATVLQIVGWNVSAPAALLWEDPEGSPPIVTNLSDTPAIGNCASKWLLQEAHAVNDNDWIITWGTDVEGFTGAYAILLTPFPECPLDIVPNQFVDTDDLLFLLGMWGPCPIGVICDADVDGNCEVDTDDMLALFSRWEENPCEESLLGGNGPPSLEELIVIVLESTASDEEKAAIIEFLLSNFN